MLICPRKVRKKCFACYLAMRKRTSTQHPNGRFGKERDLGWCGDSMVGPQLGRETYAIAESAYTIERRLCVCDIIIRSAGKVVWPKPASQPVAPPLIWPVWSQEEYQYPSLFEQVFHFTYVRDGLSHCLILQLTCGFHNQIGAFQESVFPEQNQQIYMVYSPFGYFNPIS